MEQINPEPFNHTKEEIIPINVLILVNNNLQKMDSYILNRTKNTICVEIPRDFQSIIDTDKKLAFDWKMKTRAMFVERFEAGYTVIDFFQLGSGAIKHNIYAR